MATDSLHKRTLACTQAQTATELSPPAHIRTCRREEYLRQARIATPEHAKRSPNNGKPRLALSRLARMATCDVATTNERASSKAACKMVSCRVITWAAHKIAAIEPPRTGHRGCRAPSIARRMRNTVGRSNSSRGDRSPASPTTDTTDILRTQPSRRHTRSKRELDNGEPAPPSHAGRNATSTCTRRHHGIRRLARSPRNCNRNWFEGRQPALRVAKAPAPPAAVRPRADTTN